MKEPSSGEVGASPTEQGISFVLELGEFEGNISLSILGKEEVGRSGLKWLAAVLMQIVLKMNPDNHVSGDCLETVPSSSVLFPRKRERHLIVALFKKELS